MKRIFLTVLDACGVGELPDAADYGDVGACTIGHAVDACHPSLPNMAHMGLGQIAGAHYPADENAVGAFGMCREASKGKDTTTGHWEIAGVTLAKPFPTFPNGFPADFIAAFEQRIGHKVIGNKPASGTAILDELGEEHLAKRTPIVYTSADSVFQIACNEAIFSREELYEMCRIAREMLTGDLCVGRVIARPFVGEKAGAFQRTSGRRDFSVEPFSRTLLDAVKDAGMESYGVGKIEDIFALRGLTGSNHAAGNPACIEAWLDYMRKPFDGLCFTNLVDTDMLYGHRNDVDGYAKEESTHMAVAVNVLTGAADCGMGIFAAARALGLDFVPLARERYDLAVPERFWEDPRILAVRDMLLTDAFKTRLENLGGYETRLTGRTMRPGVRLGE